MTSFRSRIAHPLLRALYDYWLVRRDPGGFIRRADFDPTAIPQLLKHLILSDVVAAAPGAPGPAIRYRVVGTEIVAAHGADYTGRTLEELVGGGPTLDYTRRLYATVIDRAVPVYSEGQFRWARKEHRLTRRLHLPMSRGGSAVDAVLAGQVFESGPGSSTEVMIAADEAGLAADLAALQRPA